MASIKLLTARQLDSLKTGFHSDGGNLYLRVRDTETRAWVFRYALAGKVRELGLGPVASRTLAQARELAGRMRTALADGKDPAALVRAKRDSKALTFAELGTQLRGAYAALASPSVVVGAEAKRERGDGARSRRQEVRQ